MKQLSWSLTLLALVPATTGAQTPDVTGDPLYVRNLATLVEESTHIRVLQVMDVARDERTILLQTVAELKAGAAGTVSAVRVPTMVLRWAEPGRLALAFETKDLRMVCLGNSWLQADTWVIEGSNIPSSETPVWQPVDDRGHDWGATYVGPIENLIRHVKDLRAGRDVVLTARYEAPGAFHDHPPQLQGDWSRGQKGRVYRLRVSSNRRRPDDIVGLGMGGAERVPALARALDHADALVRAEAAEDLGQLGPLAREAVESLRNRLKDADPHVRIFAATALALIQPDRPVEIETFRTGLKHADAAVRSAAIGALVSLAARAQAAVPDLLALLRTDKDVREAAIYALGEIGPEAALAGCGPEAIVPALARIMAEEKGAAGGWAAKALAQFGTAARPSLAAARRVIHDETMGGVLAADVLCRMGPAGVAAVVEALDHQANENLHDDLGKLGRRGRFAIPVLMGSLHDKERASPYGTARALLNIDRKLSAPVVLPVLLNWLKERDSDDTLKRIVLFQLARQLGADARDIVPAIVPYLDDPDWHRRREAADALGVIGPPARAALPALRTAMADKDRNLRFAAAQAIWHISGDAKDVLPVWRACFLDPGTPFWMRRELWSLLEKCAALDERTILDLVALLKQKQNDDDRAGVLHVLAELGPRAKPAQPALRRLLQQEKAPLLRLRVILALALIDPAAAEGLTGLQAILQDPDDEVRLGALAVLTVERQRKLPAEVTGAVVPLLAHALADVNRDVRSSAAEALGMLGPAAQPAIPALVALLKDLNPDVRQEGLKALYRVDPQHEAIVPALVQLLGEAPGYFRWLEPMMAELGPRARPAVPVLLRLTRKLELDDTMQMIDVMEKIEPEIAARLWPREETGPAAFSGPELEALWSDLGSGSTPRGHRAYWKLVLAPQPRLAFLKGRLAVVPKVEPAQIARWIADLQNDRFEVRQKATESLARIEQLAKPALRRALAARPSLEVCQRLDRLLDRLDPARSGDRQRTLWCVEILERVGSAEAAAVLRELAGGAKEARLTIDAQAALDRLAGRSTPKQ